MTTTAHTVSCFLRAWYVQSASHALTPSQWPLSPCHPLGFGSEATEAQSSGSHPQAWAAACRFWGWTRKRVGGHGGAAGTAFPPVRHTRTALRGSSGGSTDFAKE